LDSIVSAANATTQGSTMDAEGFSCMLHNASYDFNDELIPLGATYWVRLVQAWLKTDA
jgi:hippurate hydrolase